MGLLFLKVWFIQDAVIFRVLFRQVSLYCQRTLDNVTMHILFSYVQYREQSQ